MVQETYAHRNPFVSAAKIDLTRPSGRNNSTKLCTSPTEYITVRFQRANHRGLAVMRIAQVVVRSISSASALQRGRNAKL